MTKRQVGGEGTTRDAETPMGNGAACDAPAADGRGDGKPPAESSPGGSSPQDAEDRPQAAGAGGARRRRGGRGRKAADAASSAATGPGKGAPSSGAASDGTKGATARAGRRAAAASGAPLTDVPVITTTEELAEFCAHAARAPYVTVDTEFLRDRTYFARLCLVQLAYRGEPGETDAVIVDPIQGAELSLEPLHALLADPGVVKVFHAARQDVEIFWQATGRIPEPLFDTQVAAMVCGFGEQVGYETLVRRIAQASLDKSSRFTDWSHRPLTDAQKAYAIADVTYLRDIYEFLSARLQETGRSHWVAEEMAVLTDPETYRADPEQAWARIRTRSATPRFLGIVKALAAFREDYARRRNIPRNRVFKDEALVELASARPSSLEDLGRTRLLLREARRGELAEGILAAVRRGLEMPQDELPQPDRSREKLNVNPAIADLLRVLLKAKAEESGVAARLIASASDLDRLAAGQRDVPALRGWRREVFGEDALRLCEGRIALTARGREVRAVEV